VLRWWLGAARGVLGLGFYRASRGVEGVRMRALTPGVKRFDGAPIDGLHQSAFEEGMNALGCVPGSVEKKGGDADVRAPRCSERERESGERRQVGPTVQ